LTDHDVLQWYFSEIHKSTVSHVMHAPFAWFEATPSGRILSRFSADLGQVDHLLVMLLDDIQQFTFNILAFVVTIGSVLIGVSGAKGWPIVLLLMGRKKNTGHSLEILDRDHRTCLRLFFFVIFSLGGFLWLNYRVTRLNQEVKRLSNQALGPVMTLVQESVNGRAVICGMHLEPFFEQKFHAVLDSYLELHCFSLTVMHAGFLIVSFLAYAISISAAAFVIIHREDYAKNPAMIGVVLGYSFILPYFFAIYVLMCGAILMLLTSLERVME